jgi:hypothetical protein
MQFIYQGITVSPNEVDATMTWVVADNAGNVIGEHSVVFRVPNGTTITQAVVLGYTYLRDELDERLKWVDKFLEASAREALKQSD